jgi:hypothetical protein
VDDWADTAAILTKVAADHEAANGREIFENATALVATKEAGHMHAGRRVVRRAVRPRAPSPPAPAARGGAPSIGGVVPKFHDSFFSRFMNPAKQREHQAAKDLHAAGRATIPGTSEHAVASTAAQAKATAAESAAAGARSHELKEKVVTHTAPLMAAAVGVPMALQAMKRDPAKKEEVKIYK